MWIKRKKRIINAEAELAPNVLGGLRAVEDINTATAGQIAAAVTIMIGFEKAAMKKMVTGHTASEYGARVDAMYGRLSALLASNKMDTAALSVEQVALGVIMEGRIAAFVRRRYLLPDNSVRNWVETDYRRYEQVYTYAVITAAMVERLMDFYPLAEGRRATRVAVELSRMLVPQTGLDWMRHRRFEGCVWDDWKEYFEPGVHSLMRDIVHHSKYKMHEQDGWSASLSQFFPEALKEGVRKRMVSAEPGNQDDKEFTPRSSGSLESRDMLGPAPVIDRAVPAADDPHLKTALEAFRQCFGKDTVDAGVLAVARATAAGQAVLAWPAAYDFIIEHADLPVSRRQLKRRFTEAGMLQFDGNLTAAVPLDGAEPFKGHVLENGHLIFGPDKPQPTVAVEAEEPRTTQEAMAAE
ncbi:hypothetical protein D3OALGB2SA_3172 [Olavius algarvensis associated proteobacterium Delta 3]|nr:hypothetical protein D3OALGB2SA_3172 [Olavius algarvensis associated proteobacterium Delta 3]